jgi:aerotaxis receptor
VQANVIPVVEGTELKGHISIRTRPARDAVAAAEAIYADMRAGRSRGLRIVGGAAVRTGRRATWNRVTRGIASGFALNLGILFVAVVASLLAGVAGLGAGVRGSGLAVIGILVIISSLLSMRRMRQAFARIEAQFDALARGALP